MSKMAELAYDIEQLYIEGFRPVTIAGLLDCPVDLVTDWFDTNKISQVEAEKENEYSNY